MRNFNTLVNIALLFTFFVSSLSLAGPIIGEVIAVADGDTITVLSHGVKHKVRLFGIDAPEKKQAYGKQSKQSLVDMVHKKTVTINYNKRDRYRRIIGKVILERQDVNLEQVRRGLAWHYKKYQKEQEVEDRGLYSQEEYLARKNQLGLWNDSNPMPPWEWRKR
ncbi:MAG: thermonuclease family protein [Methylophilaceae bacterium]